MLFCDEHLHRHVRINDKLQAGIASEIPPEVVREALVNLLGHSVTLTTPSVTSSAVELPPVGRSSADKPFS